MTIRALCLLSRLASLLLVINIFAAAQSAAAPTSAAPASSATGLPYRPSLDVTAMDKSADPCVDFYQYSCGSWKKANPVPADRTSWGRYAQLYEDNLDLLRSILERAALAKDRDAVDQKIGDFYGSCMDEAAVNLRAAAPIKAHLDAITAVKSMRELAP